MSSVSRTTTTVFVDDFESVVQYSNNADFDTPDPSNATEVANEEKAGYYAGTYHSTNVSQAAFALNFTGTSVSVYGDMGSAYGAYAVTLDGNTTSYSAYAPASCISCPLFHAEGLSAGPLHSLKVTNLNASLLFDWLEFTTDVGAPGTTVKNTTIEETDPALKYTGTWGHNSSPKFSGGGSTFTNTSSSVSLTFNGSAIYVWGDTNANHGQYSVTLDSDPAEVYKSVTGCGLPYQVQGACEQTVPGLTYFRSYLSAGAHKLTIENIPGPSGTFFDLDRITYTTPAQYFAANSTGPSGGGGGGGGGGGSGGSSSTNSATSSSPSATHSSGGSLRLAAPNFSLGPAASTSPLTAAMTLAFLTIWFTMFFRLHRSA